MEGKNNMSKIKIEKMCGDDKSIPKKIHTRIKLTVDRIMDPFEDVKWSDVYCIMENMYKEGRKKQ